MEETRQAPLFDAEFYRRISRVKLAITKKSASPMQGRRRSLLKGNSAEFSDYREYLPGDDIRRIDWNVLARLDKPYIRRYMEERESSLNLFLDLSASMGFWGKDVLAKRLAGALCAVALLNLDRVSLYIVTGEGVREWRFSGGSASLKRCMGMIEKAERCGSSDLAGAVKGAGILQSGMTVVISDFFDEAFLENGDKLCRLLNYQKQQPFLVQVMAKEELKVPFSGTCALEDSEGLYDMVRVSMDEKTLKNYEDELDGFLKTVEKIAACHNTGYYLCSTEDDYAKLLFTKMRRLFDEK